MTTEYAYVYVEKDVEEDVFESGCVGKRERGLADNVNIVSNTIPELLKAIGERYGLDIDDVWLPGEDGTEDRIGYNRLETDDGDEPSEAETEAWKRGELRLWLADYDFTVEKREVSGIPTAEFANIKHHD